MEHEKSKIQNFRQRQKLVDAAAYAAAAKLLARLAKDEKVPPPSELEKRGLALLNDYYSDFCSCKTIVNEAYSGRRAGAEAAVLKKIYGMTIDEAREKADALRASAGEK